METLSTLISLAMNLAGEDAVGHAGRVWHVSGGRACPIGWSDCSQLVFRDLKTDEYDYGEINGPGHQHCVANCRHGMEPVLN